MGPEGSKSHVTTRVMGTFGYAAPEYVSTGSYFMLCLLPRKFHEKYKGKKIKRTRRKEGKIKIELNLTYYFVCYFKLIVFILIHEYKDH